MALVDCAPPGCLAHPSLIKSGERDDLEDFDMVERRRPFPLGPHHRQGHSFPSLWWWIDFDGVRDQTIGVSLRATGFGLRDFLPAALLAIFRFPYSARPSAKC